jgi:hypothetical protein
MKTTQRQLTTAVGYYLAIDRQPMLVSLWKLTHVDAIDDIDGLITPYEIPMRSHASPDLRPTHCP